MKGTRLFQQAGSPLIQGRSRTERPFWAVWAVAFIVSMAGWLLYEAARLVVAGDGGSLSTLVAAAGDLARTHAVAAALGAASGSVAGVWVARGAGSRSAWIAGAVVGTIGAVVSAGAFGPMVAAWILG